MAPLKIYHCLGFPPLILLFSLSCPPDLGVRMDLWWDCRTTTWLCYLGRPWWYIFHWGTGEEATDISEKHNGGCPLWAETDRRCCCNRTPEYQLETKECPNGKEQMAGHKYYNGKPGWGATRVICDPQRSVMVAYRSWCSEGKDRWGVFVFRREGVFLDSNIF